MHVVQVLTTLICKSNKNRFLTKIFVSASDEKSSLMVTWVLSERAMIHMWKNFFQSALKRDGEGKREKTRKTVAKIFPLYGNTKIFWEHIYLNVYDRIVCDQVVEANKFNDHWCIKKFSERPRTNKRPITRLL